MIGSCFCKSMDCGMPAFPPAAIQVLDQFPGFTIALIPADTKGGVLIGNHMLAIF
jgi:hypothetical protein